MTSEATVPTASNCCVLLVCGAPGSGKSTLARFLHTEFEERSINSHILSFDDYEVPSTLWDSETFTQSRQVSLLALENLLHEQQYRVLIVDDIMFYCGMRKKVYQLARQHGAGYAVVHVDVPIAVAQARNTTRSEDTRVHPKSVARIFDLFEKPASGCDGGWERVHLTVNGCLSLAKTGVATAPPAEIFDQVLDLLSQADVVLQQRIADMHTEAFKLQQKEQSLEERRKWEQQEMVGQAKRPPLPAACLLQALDLKMRHITAFIMKQYHGPKEDLRAISQILSEMKKITLAHARTCLQVPVSSQPTAVYSIDDFLIMHFGGYFKELIFHEQGEDLTKQKEDDSDLRNSDSAILNYIRSSARFYFAQQEQEQEQEQKEEEE